MFTQGFQGVPGEKFINKIKNYDSLNHGLFEQVSFQNKTGQISLNFT
jgi:hypothetical protein